MFTRQNWPFLKLYFSACAMSHTRLVYWSAKKLEKIYFLVDAPQKYFILGSFSCIIMMIN
jgi:hypothetical protein